MCHANDIETDGVRTKHQLAHALLQWVSPPILVDDSSIPLRQSRVPNSVIQPLSSPRLLLSRRPLVPSGVLTLGSPSVVEVKC